jgi:hypothetical protein
VGLGPVGLPPVAVAVSKEEHAELLLGPGERLRGVGARAAQVAHRLICSFGDVDRGQFTRPVKAGEFAGVAPIGFDSHWV